VYGEHIQSPQLDYAIQLLSTLETDLDNVFYVTSGTEAVEAAMKLARKHTGRYEIVAAANAYHGSTLGSESLRSDILFTQHFVPAVPGIKHIRFNHIEDLATIDHRTAAVIMEPVQAEAGIRAPHDGYLAAVQKICNEVGALFILDEIQTGFGRTGYMFAHQKYNVTPDVLLISKAMGGGMPIGAVVARKNVMQALAKSPMLGHINTFGGHPVCVAAAHAALEVLRTTDIVSTVIEREEYVRTLLHHPKIKEVRSSGLMMAVELHDEKWVAPVVNACIEKGLLVDYFLFDPRSIRIAPPLIITKEQLADGVAIFLGVLNELL
jgi:acetylornithine/N-succinyldiaminopimelate aminotransferase